MSTAAEIAGTVVDPELPMLTLADLGVLREVEEDGDTVVDLLRLPGDGFHARRPGPPAA